MISALTELLSHFYQIGHFAQLEAIARTILTTIPDDTVSLHFLGLAYLRTGRSGDAARLFQKEWNKTATEQQATNPAPSPDAQTAASACYQATTELNPRFADIWYDIAKELHELDLRPQALSALRNAVIARPDFPEALLALGAIGLQAGDATAAYRGFSGLLESNPENIEARRGLDQVNRRWPELDIPPDLLKIHAPRGQTADDD